MDDSEWLLGHTDIRERINVKKELKRLSYDPLEPLLREIETKDFAILQDEFSRYRETYYFYYLSLDRFFHEMSIAARWSKGPYWVRRSGGKYTASERKLADEYNKISRFLEFDFFNCLLYARMLLDRTIALSRYFLKENNSPSFTSLNEHKKFFLRLKQPFGAHEEYAEYIRNQTTWFDMPLKFVRDKFLVHAGPKHMRIFGYPGGRYELGMMIMLPAGSDPNKPLERVKSINVSIPQLASDIEQFLTWFCNYAINAIEANKA
jgi:hypothetical protein